MIYSLLEVLLITVLVSKLLFIVTETSKRFKKANSNSGPHAKLARLRFFKI